MNYEKLYKNALERAKECHIDGLSLHQPVKDVIEHIFPELAESEDEKIRNWIRKELESKYVVDNIVNNRMADQAFAWLEKQANKRTCRNCKTFKDMHQNCPYSPIYAFKDLKEADKHLDDETNCEFWIERQDEKDSQVILPTFTFDDILALQCCMRAMSKNDELYKKLQSLHDRLHEVYGFEKQDEQKITNSKEDTDFTIYYPLKNGNGKYECIPYSFYGSLTSFSDNEDLIDFLHNCFYTKQKCEDWIKKQDEQRSSQNEDDEDLYTVANNFMPEPSWNVIIETKEEGSGAFAYDYNQMINMFKVGVNWLKSLKHRIKEE